MSLKSNIHKNTQLLLPLSFVVFIFIIFLSAFITKEYFKSSKLKELQNFIVLTTKISQLVHETQKERGYSSVYLSQKSPYFQRQLIEQREQTDKKFLQLQQFISIIQHQNIYTFLQIPINKLTKLKHLRKKIDEGNISTSKVINFYSFINEELLDIIVHISQLSSIPQITKTIIAYNNFLYAKEKAGIERALGSIILAKNSISTEEKIEFTNMMTIQKIYLKIFTQYASKENYKFYKTRITERDKEKVNKIINIILSKENNFGITPDYWLKITTLKIDKLQTIDTHLERVILQNVEHEIYNSQKLYIFYIILNILSILIFIFIVISIKKLIKSEQKLKNITDKYVISSATNLRGNIIAVSDAFCNISGYTREELIGKPHSLIRHPDMNKSTFKELWSTLKSGKNWQGKVKNLRKDGTHYWVYAHIEPLFNSKGKLEAYTAIRLDITDRIHLEEELQEGIKRDKLMMQQSKLAQMGEMINMIAHQWRQPLSAISTSAGDLLIKQSFNRYNEEYFNNKLNDIVDFSQHLSSTIDDFRNFYKEDKEKIKTNFTDLIHDSLNIVHASLQSHSIDIKLELTAQKVLFTYPNELKQVILNLIKNAEDILIENSIKSAYIKLKTYDDAEFIVLKVYDNAGGIPKEIIKDIFNPYFSTKTKKDGTGLGLYMSKIIVEEHCNGELSVKNSEEGACFTIKLKV